MPADTPTYRDALHTGREALRLGRGEEASVHLAQAVELAHTERERAEALSALARAHGNLGNYPEAERLLALAQANAAGQPETLALVQKDLGAVRWLQGQMQSARVLLQGALNAFKRFGMINDYMLASNLLGLVFYSEGEYQKALDTHEDTRRVAIELQDWLRVVIALNNLGQCYVELGLYAEAEETLTECIALTRTHHLEDIAAAPWINFGRVYQAQGRADEALAALQRALEIARGIHQRYMERQARGWLARFYLAHDDFVTAERTARDLLEFDDVPQSRTDARLVLGLCALARGEHEAALHLLSLGLIDAEMSFNKVLTLQYHAALAQLVSVPAVAEVHRRLAREQILLIRDGLRDKHAQVAFEGTPLVRSVMGSGAGRLV